jgi:hypothetical protein
MADDFIVVRQQSRATNGLHAHGKQSQSINRELWCRSIASRTLVTQLAMP